MILRFEPSYSKSKGVTFLELAKQLGSKRAARMMTEGSGTYAKDGIHVRTEEVECKANDVFALMTIHIRKEGAGAGTGAYLYHSFIETGLSEKL